METIQRETLDATEKQMKDDGRWQERQRVFMTATIIVLGCFFLTATLWQLIELQQQIVEQKPAWNSHSVAEAIKDDRLRVLGVLESEIIGRRYHLAATLLAGRVWQLYLGFITGMILSLVGAAFILGKLREGESESSMGLPGGKVSFKSSSPGVILTILGVVLMITTIVTNHKIEVEDRPHYLMEMPAPPTNSSKDQKPPLPDLPGSSSAPADSTIQRPDAKPPVLPANPGK